MNLFNNMYAAVLGWTRGTAEKKKFLYKIETKQEQKRLKIFWQKSGSVELDEIELNAYHTN